MAVRLGPALLAGLWALGVAPSAGAAGAQTAGSRPVLVARRALSTGEVIRAEDVRLERRPVAGLPRGWLDSPARAVGQRVRRPVRGGTPLLARWLEVPPRVRRGQRVKLRLVRGPLTIEAPGLAQEDGREGDWIRVRNTQSRRPVVGRVGDDGVVHVEF